VIYYTDAIEEDFESLVVACNQDFPSLAQLDLHFGNIHGSSDAVVCVLSGLKAHPTLSTVKCSWDIYTDKADFFLGAKRS
jgi:hypothetical protein